VRWKRMIVGGREDGYGMRERPFAKGRLVLRLGDYGFGRERWVVRKRGWLWDQVEDGFERGSGWLMDGGYHVCGKI